jgi:hypothetical protein
MEATCSSETSFDFQRTTRRYIPGDRTLRIFRSLLSLLILVIMQCEISELSLIEFQWNLWKGFYHSLCDARKGPFIILYKPEFVMVQCG